MALPVTFLSEALLTEPARERPIIVVHSHVVQDVWQFEELPLAVEALEDLVLVSRLFAGVESLTEAFGLLFSYPDFSSSSSIIRSLCMNANCCRHRHWRLYRSNWSRRLVILHSETRVAWLINRHKVFLIGMDPFLPSYFVRLTCNHLHLLVTVTVKLDFLCCIETLSIRNNKVRFNSFAALWRSLGDVFRICKLCSSLPFLGELMKLGHLVAREGHAGTDGKFCLLLQSERLISQ